MVNYVFILFLYCLGGVIDRDYRGNLTVLLINHGSYTYKGRKGDKIAQLIVTKIKYAPILEVKELRPTARGNNRLGSSGR